MAFLGRAAQVGVLADLIDGVQAHGAQVPGVRAGGAIQVSGAPGIGKSALLGQAAARAAARGFTVISLVGDPAATGVPYAGLQQLVAALDQGSGTGRKRVAVLLDTLAEPQRSALAAALGQTDAVVPDVFLAGLAALNLLADAAERAPVLVIADDVQWLDDPSLSILAFIARRIRTEPVLLIGAAREGYRSRLGADEMTTLTLLPLSPADSAALLTDIAPDLPAPVRRRVLADAAGNPLALAELSRTAVPGPGSGPAANQLPLTQRLEQAFTDRLVTLPAPARTLLQMAAVSDRPALEEIITAASAWSQTNIEPRDIDPAVNAMLADVVGTELRFRHPLIRSAIYQALTRADRQAAHAALARVLPASQHDRVIAHRAAATALPDEAVAASLADAAVRAARRGAIAAAVDALTRAAALSEDQKARGERLLRAADYAVELGQRDTMLHLLDQAASGVLTAQQQVKVAWLRGSFDEGLRHQASSAATLTALAQEVADSGDVTLAVRILWSAAQLCFWSDPGQPVRADVLAAAETLPLDETDPWLLAILAYVAPVERAATVISRMRGMIPSSDDDGRAYRMLSTAALLCGAFDLSRGFSAAGSAPLRAQGRLGLLARVVGAEAWSAIVMGDLGAAIVACDESRRLARETTQQLMYALMCATAAKLAALRGDTAGAHDLAEEAERLGLPAGARPVLATALMARGLAALADGRFDEAYGHFRRLHDPADPAYQVSLRLSSLGDLVDAAAHCGRLDDVRPVVEELAAIATVTPAPVLHADLRLGRAMLAEEDQAAELFEAALRADLAQWPLLRSRTQLAYGEWLRRHRRAVESRDHLRAARDMFDALGAIPWSERARAELRAAGEASRRRDLDARDQLTPHELQIAQLAAQGLTNREIGQRLYLSHRTVSSHLHRIFPKLGIASRSELRVLITVM